MEAQESNIEPTVEITKERYEQLLFTEKKLSVLECHGVDNWEWYGEAMATLYGEEGEDEF